MAQQKAPQGAKNLAKAAAKRVEEVLGPKIVADFKNRVFDNRAYAVLRNADYLRAMDATPRQREQLATIQSRREQELRQHEQRRNEESLDVLSRGQQKKLRAELQRREDAAGKDGGAYASPFLPVPTPTSAAIRGAIVVSSGTLSTSSYATPSPIVEPYTLSSALPVAALPPGVPGGYVPAEVTVLGYGDLTSETVRRQLDFTPSQEKRWQEMTAKYSEALEGPSPPRDRAV